MCQIFVSFVCDNTNKSTKCPLIQQLQYSFLPGFTTKRCVQMLQLTNLDLCQNNLTGTLPESWSSLAQVSNVAVTPCMQKVCHTARLASVVCLQDFKRGVHVADGLTALLKEPSCLH